MIRRARSSTARRTLAGLLLLLVAQTAPKAFALDGRWSKILSGPAAGRFAFSMAYDPVRERLIA